ncbi:MAG: 16S rRNA processing protein RimM [Anaerolineae bacterium]|nr:16S rRNA processing protein RimM [Anaerolineae bacterium]
MPPDSTSPDPPPFLLLGRILRPHGIRGELRVEVLTDFPERIGPDTQIVVGTDPENVSSAVTYQVVKARKHQHFLILQFEGINDRNSADPLRGHYIMVAFKDAVPLEEGEFYLFQLIGLPVYTVDEDFLGEITDVIETGANDVYVVHGPYGEVLLPVVDDCVKRVDINAGRVTVQLMDGLLGE